MKRYENHNKNEDNLAKFFKVRKVSWDNETFYIIRLNNVWETRKSSTQSPEVNIFQRNTETSLKSFSSYRKVAKKTERWKVREISKKKV